MPESGRTITIAGRPIGLNHPPYLIAELSGNHNGNIEHAFAIMEAAARAGADAVKLQTYTPDTLTIDCDRDDFRISGGLWNGRKLYELYQEAHTPWDWMEPLFRKGRELGVTVFSTPFDETAVDLLEDLDAPAYKIASFENTDHALIERAARTGKPLIISTGMASIGDVVETADVARKAGASELIFLHCVSAYPAPASDANLATIPHLAEAVDAVVGLSDHTLGIGVAAGAVALGAAVIEKHVTLRRADGGPDAAFSLEPEELAQMVTACRDVHAAVGRVRYAGKRSEAESMKFRRSLYVVEDIDTGEAFTPRNVRCIRPGYGLPPKALSRVIGRRATEAVSRGTPLPWDLVT